MHKQFYFVLTEESLTFYRKKNDSRAKGEVALPVKVVPLPKYSEEHAFRVIPRKFDKYHMQHLEAPEESIILYADNGHIEKEWTNKMQSISDRIMEPYIFPDSLQSQKDGHDLSNDFDATQQEKIRKFV